MINEDRLAEVKNRSLSFYLNEIAIRDAISDGPEYYDYIINNVALDRGNPKNSFIMFVNDKVDSVDFSRPCDFTDRSTTLPDIDVDFPTNEREAGIDYVRQKYGESHVCQIATFSRLSGRSAIKAVLRTEGFVDFATMNDITDGIPDEAEISDQLENMSDPSVIRWSLTYNADKLKDFCVLNEDGSLDGEYSETFRKALLLEGTFQNQGKHAAGVIISSERVSDVSPMVLGKDGRPIAALDMGDLEKAGLVKFDFLGVDILNKVDEVCKTVGIEAEEIDLDDQKSWDMISSGNTKGCFQIESKLGFHWSKELKPGNIDELAALISIIRPGSLSSKHEDGRSMTQVYCDRKNGIEDMEESATSSVIDTFDVLIYQETLLKIAKTLAGFNSAQSIKLMKSVGKKDAKLLFSLQEQFLTGCSKVGRIKEEPAKTLFENIKAAARYSFNRSHAVGYSLPAYWSAYLKTHHKLEFYKTWLKYSKNKIDPYIEVKNLVISARMDGVEILPPSCEYLAHDFFIRGGSVVYGLSNIKSVSSKELTKLFDWMRTNGPASSVVSYMFGIFPYVNKGTLLSLVDAGCFAYLGQSRAMLRHLYTCCIGGFTKLEISGINLAIVDGENLEDLLTRVLKPKREGGVISTAPRVLKAMGVLEKIQNTGRDMLDTPAKVAMMEESLIGSALSVNYMDQCMQGGSGDTTCCDIKFGKKGKCTLVVRVSEVKEHIIKKSGDKMAFVVVSDDSGECDMVVFAKEYEVFSPLLYEGAFVSIFGESGKKGSLIINKVVEL